MGPNASAARSVQPFAPRKWGGSGTEAAARADSSNARSRAPSPLGADPHLPSYSLVKQPSSFPRRVFCARGLLLLRAPGMRGGRSTERTSGTCEAPVRRVRTRQALVRRLASLGVGRSPLGAPPWRFWARGRASLTGLASGSVTASSSHPGPSARRAGPGPPETSGYQPAAAGRHSPLHLQEGGSRRHPSGARMNVYIVWARYAVNRKK